MMSDSDGIDEDDVEDPPARDEHDCEHDLAAAGVWNGVSGSEADDIDYVAHDEQRTGNRSEVEEADEEALRDRRDGAAKVVWLGALS